MRGHTGAAAGTETAAGSLGQKVGGESRIPRLCSCALQWGGALHRFASVNERGVYAYMN